MPRYGRRNKDGDYEYYDSHESLVNAKNQEKVEQRAGIFGFIGLILGGVLCYFSIKEFGLVDWPQWLKFSLIIISGVIFSVLLHQLANVLWITIMALLTGAILLGIGSMIWHGIELNS